MGYVLLTVGVALKNVMVSPTLNPRALASSDDGKLKLNVTLDGVEGGRVKVYLLVGWLYTIAHPVGIKAKSCSRKVSAL
jgi:hypothetical protein